MLLLLAKLDPDGVGLEYLDLEKLPWLGLVIVTAEIGKVDETGYLEIVLAPKKSPSADRNFFL